MMSRKMKASVLAMLLAFVLALAACDSGSDTPPATDPVTDPTGQTTGSAGEPATTESTANGRDDIILYINSDINTLDLAMVSLINEQQITWNIYDPLVFVDKDHNEHMRLAESYEVSDDGLVYTFKLREGVLFHNGEELKASDVVFTYDRCSTSPYRSGQMEEYESSRAVDDYTFELTLKNIYAPMMEMMIKEIVIVNEKAVTELGDDYGLNPVGTGPYQFVSYETTNQIKLTRFDDYYRGPARIKDVTYKIITDANTAAVALQTGEIDMGGFAVASYQNMISDPNLIVEEPSTTHITYLMMNHEVAPFDNVLVRQAVNYALDREFIVEAAMGGFARPTSIVLATDVMGYSPDIRGYEYDPDKAIELLAQAGITTPLEVGAIKTLDGIFKTTAEIIKSNLADIGLIADIEVLEATKYVDEAHDGDYILGMMGTDNGNDADGFNMMFSAAYIGNQNMGRYSNPEVDRLFAQGRSQLDAAKREEIYAECFNIITDDAVYAALFNQSKPFAHSKDLQVDYFDPMMHYVYEMGWK